ncbi:MAG: hypothetical protein HC882_05140, partial [Acidobacteria bacterium]|nr:hypothetical protein [Acidobacteriota bacterium]
MVRAEAPARLRVVVPSNLPVLADLQSTDAPLGEIPNVFPDALALGQTRAAPEAGAAPASTLVTLGRGATDATFPTIDVRFDTVTDGWTPPDPVMAAGPNHVVVLINARIAIYDTAGTLVQGPFSLEQFFGIPPEFFDFDPLAIWDPHSRRFIVATLSDRSASNDSRLYVAFSQTENATGAWNTYFIDADRDQPNIWADYASVGIDRNAVYFTANMFSRSSAFRNVTLFIYDKEDGYAGRPLDNVHLIDVRTQGGGSPFRLRPAWIGRGRGGRPFFLAHVFGS